MYGQHISYKLFCFIHRQWLSVNWRNIQTFPSYSSPWFYFFADISSTWTWTSSLLCDVTLRCCKRRPIHFSHNPSVCPSHCMSCVVSSDMKGQYLQHAIEWYSFWLKYIQFAWCLSNFCDAWYRAGKAKLFTDWLPNLPWKLRGNNKWYNWALFFQYCQVTLHICR